MNAIEHAKSHIANEIDDKILQYCFKETYNTQIIAALSVMENKVIRNVVLKEINLLDGEEKRVPFSACKLLFRAGDYMLVEVPPAILNNRPILTADHLASGTVGQGRTNNVGGLSGMMIDMLNNLSATDTYVNAKLEVMNNNIIKIGQVGFIEPNAILTVRVQSNPNLSNLPATTHVDFAKLCLIGVKKWIYNKKRIDIATAALNGGAELSIIKEIVDEWSDKGTEYEEERAKFISIMNMSDRSFMDSQIKIGVGNLRV